MLNGFSCGSVACDVPPYEPLATTEPSSISLCKLKDTNDIESLSLSVADILPADAPFDEFSFSPVTCWLLKVGAKLSVTFMVIGKKVLESESSPLS